MIVFLGLENVTSSFTFTGSNSLGVTATSSSNSLTVTGMAHDSGSINFTAVSASVSLTKTMNLAKSKTGESGSTAKTLTLTADSQVFTFPSASATTPDDNTIELFINQQNLSGTIVAGDVTITDANGSSLYLVPTLAPSSLTDGTGVVSGSLVFGTNTPNGSNKNKFPITIDVSKDNVSDTFKIFTLDGGSDGSDGADAYTVFLTNESHTFPAANDGTVDNSDLADGLTEVRVFKGTTQLTLDTSSPYGANTYRTSKSQTGITLSNGIVNNQRKFTPTGVSADTGTAEITIIDNTDNTTFTKTYSFSKSTAGAAGAAGATGATGPNFDFLTGSISEVDTIGGLNAGLLMTSNVLGFHGNISEGDGTNATINDFITFLDSSGNFFIGSASSGHFAYSQTTGQLLVSGSEVDIQTPNFFLGSTNNQFVSGANGNIEISSSKFHVKPDGDVIVRKVSAEEGTIGGFTISSDEVRSSNNRLRLKDNGQITGSVVLFTGGTISGFDITADKITGGFIPASSSILNTVVSASLQLDGPIETSTVSVDSFTTNAANGAAFWEALRQAGTSMKIKANSGTNYYNISSTETNTFTPIGSVNAGTISIGGLNYIQTGFTNQPHTLVDTGGSTLTVVSSSIQNFPETPASLVLKDSGQITGSNVLFDGGTIGGFSIGSNSLTTTGVEINDSSQALFISSSGFKVSHPGAVTATSIVVQNSAGTLLNTATGFSDGKNIARNLPIQSTSDTPFVVFLDGEQKLVVMAMSNQNNGGNSVLSGTLGISFQRFLPDQSPSPETDTGNWTFTNPPSNEGAAVNQRRVIRHIIDLSSMGSSNRDLTSAPAFISVTGTNIQTSQVQVTVHRNVGSTGASGDKNGGVIDTT